MKKNEEKIEEKNEVRIRLKADEFLEELENEVDETGEEVEVDRVGNQLARVSRGENYIDFKLIMKFGDKQKAKALNRADSILYDESAGDKVEMKLKDNDIDTFLLEKQIVGSDLGKLDAKAIQENETHSDLFEKAVEVIKLKNGLVMTKKQLEKKKSKKA